MKLLMKGNEAIAEAALRANCRLFFGYPITPSTEVPEYMAKKMRTYGGTYLKAESEWQRLIWSLVLRQPENGL